MPTSARMSTLFVAGLLLCGQTGCNVVPQHALAQSQHRTVQLYRQNQAVAAQRDQAVQQAQTLRQSLGTAHRRLDNLNAERSTLQERFVSLLNRARNQRSPLSEEATRRFQELAERYPEFEFDPQTGVSKFHSDILFDSGSDDIHSKAHPILQEFANIMNDGDAKRLNILVVGHTDNQRIAKRSTKSKHPTNWHLSTNRANSVVLSLAKSGVKEHRMGVAGYSKHQPIASNKDEKSRRQNRRVEIFVLATDAVVAGWDPWTSWN